MARKAYKVLGLLNEAYSYNIAGVYLCGTTNSTLFTECCDTAICADEAKCPNCSRRVIGYDLTPHYRDMKRWKYAYKKIP